jgi:hypothetical protein
LPEAPSGDVRTVGSAVETYSLAATAPPYDPAGTVRVIWAPLVRTVAPAVEAVAVYEVTVTCTYVVPVGTVAIRWSLPG